MNDKPVKNSFNLKDLMALLDGKSRTTIYRMRQKGILPEPDIDDGAHPIWFRATLEKHLPNFTGQS
ncbi:MAG TPA: hypothetical protein VK974_04905 [Methylophilaceae bacterium]|nr:hypothetical protein [Methylophilaceae bacterium]